MRTSLVVIIGIVLSVTLAVGIYLMTNVRSTDKDDWERQWDARQQALESIFGPADDMVLHSPIPFYLGGAADVLVFRQHHHGTVYVTADLIGDEASKPNVLGQYELMICTPEDSEWAPQLISNLAKYTTEAVLAPHDTMDIGPALPPPTQITAFLYLPYASMEVSGRPAAVMLCLGITQSELAYIQQHDVEQLVEALKTAGVYPMTDLTRASVPLP